MTEEQDKPFVPSIMGGLPDEESEMQAPPQLTFAQRIQGMFRNMGIKRWFRQETAKAKKRRQKFQNPPGTKFVRAAYKAKHGHKPETAEAAWEWYSNLAEPELRAGASHHERKRHEQAKAAEAAGPSA